MNLPKRLLDDDTTELERLLLEAVAHERPSRSLTRRMRAGLGLAGSLFTLKAAAATLSAVAVVATAAVVVDPTSEAPAPSAAPAKVVAAKPAPPSPPEPPALEPPPAPEPPPTATAQPRSAVAPPPTPVPAKPKAAPATDLRPQIQLLERARAALRKRAPAEALAALDRYRKLYPNGAFAQEASVLRVEALQQSGQHAKASRLAQDFIRKHGDSPHVERLSQSLEPAAPKR